MFVFLSLAYFISFTSIHFPRNDVIIVSYIAFHSIQAIVVKVHPTWRTSATVATSIVSDGELGQQPINKPGSELTATL